MFKEKCLQSGEWVPKIHEIASKMMKTWSKEILKAWQKVWVSTYRIMVNENKEFFSQKTPSFQLAMGLNDK